MTSPRRAKPASGTDPIDDMKKPLAVLAGVPQWQRLSDQDGQRRIRVGASGIGRKHAHFYDGMNMYTYVGNNPVNFVDPFGLCKGDSDSFWRNAWEGKYFGTGYGASSLDAYTQGMLESDSWYGWTGNFLGAYFSALWTPETYKETAVVLAAGYGLRNAGQAWQLADGTSARTIVDYGNVFRMERHMIGRGLARASRWHIDALWGAVRHWPWGL